MTPREKTALVLSAAWIVLGFVWIVLEVTVARWRRRPDTTPFVQQTNVRVLPQRGGQR